MNPSLSRAVVLTLAVSLWGVSPPNAHADDVAVSLLSKNQAGAQASGPSSLSAVSGSGQRIAFLSNSANLAPAGGSDNRPDVYLLDRASGSITLETPSLNNAADGQFSSLSMSSDGNFITFSSNTSRLTNGSATIGIQIFIRNVSTGITLRVTQPAISQTGNNASFTPSLSGDGARLTFSSFVSSLVAGDTNNLEDVFAFEHATNTINRVSVSADGTQANGASSLPAISRNGRFVAFQSFATNLGNFGTTSQVPHIFRKDLLTGEVILVSKNANGELANNGSSFPSLSADGRYVSYSSFATNLVDGDTKTNLDIFVFDTAAGTTVRASTTASGQETDFNSDDARLTDDGRSVTFSSGANLTNEAGSAVIMAYRKDLVTGAVTLVSRNSVGTEPRGQGYSPRADATASFVAFTSSQQLISSDLNASQTDIFGAVITPTVPLPPPAPIRLSGPSVRVVRNRLVYKMTQVPGAGYRAYLQKVDRRRKVKTITSVPSRRNTATISRCIRKGTYRVIYQVIENRVRRNSPARSLRLKKDVGCRR